MELKKQNARGITLIALVITIIILLILAGVALARLIGDNGALTQADKAEAQTNKANAKEAVQVEVSGGFDENGYNKDLAIANLKKNLKMSDDNITDNGDGTLAGEYNGYKFCVDKKGKVMGGDEIWIYNGNDTFSKGEIRVSIGDYVYYNEAGTGSYKADITKGAGNVKYNTTTSEYELTEAAEYTTEDLSWRVLGVNNIGELKLISDRPHSVKLGLAGEKAYLNGEDILNEFCYTLYGNGTDDNGNKVVSEARSLKVEDINKVVRFDPTTYKSSTRNYGDIMTIRFPTNGDYMQYKKTYADGTLIKDWTDCEERYQTFRMPGETEIINNENRNDKGVSFTNTYYEYSVDRYTSLFTSDEDGWVRTKQWLANKAVEIYNVGSGAFGFRSLEGKYVTMSGETNGSEMYTAYSPERIRGMEMYVRPVVSLKIDAQLSGNSTDGWTIN